MKLVKRIMQPWPIEGAFLGGRGVASLREQVARRALRDACMLEVPTGSNRGKYIDLYLRRAHVPESLITTGKGWYCASWAGAVFVDAGALVPADYGSCDAWLPFVEPAGYKPQTGDAILYGVPGDAHHIGIVLVPEYKITIEANRSLKDQGNNGLGIFVGPSSRTDVLGYVQPRVE